MSSQSIEMKDDPANASAKPNNMGRGVGGRQKLIEAAMQLASTTSSLASLGLREVTRYAGLAPNSFYRHFKTFDDLGIAAVAMMGAELRRGLRERRRRPGQTRKEPKLISQPDQMISEGRKIIRETTNLVLDFVVEHPTAYIVGMRELNGSSPTMRKAVKRLMEDFAEDMTEDIRAMMHMPGVDAKTMSEISRQIIRQMSFFSMDYLEHPERREEISEQAERFIMRMFAGELAMAGLVKKSRRKPARR